MLTTSLSTTQAGTAQVAAAYRQLSNIEARFWTLKDFLRLRPVRHWTEQRVRGHVAICVYAAVIETLIGCDLAKADVRDPDLDNQHLSAARALRELNRIRRVHSPPKDAASTSPPGAPHCKPEPSPPSEPTPAWDKATIT